MSMRCVDWKKKKEKKRGQTKKTERIAHEHALCGLGKKEKLKIKKRANEKTERIAQEHAISEFCELIVCNVCNKK